MGRACDGEDGERDLNGNDTANDDNGRDGVGMG